MTWTTPLTGYAGSTNGISVSLNVGDTTGKTYGFCSVNSVSSVGPPTITDNFGNTWTEIETIVNSFARLTTYQCKNPSVGAAHTLTTEAIGDSPSIFALFSTGVRQVTHTDQSASLNTGTSETYQPGSITPSENDCLVIAVSSIGGTGTTPTIGGYTVVGGIVLNASGNHLGGVLGWVIQTTATATNPTIDSNSTAGQPRCAAIYSFLPQLNEPYITIDNHTNLSIFQREKNTTWKNVEVSGTYDQSIGAEPTSVEVKTTNYDDDALVEDWQTVDDLVIGSGSWIGTIVVYQGLWRKFTARMKDVDGNVLATSEATTAQTGVGILLGGIGQSNMHRMFQPFTTPTPNAYTMMYDGTWRETEGNGAIILTDLVQQATGVLIGFINGSVSGSGLFYDTGLGPGKWVSLTAGQPYPEFVETIGAVGGDMEFILAGNGEADAELPTSQFDFMDSLSLVYRRLQAVLDRTPAELGFGVWIMGKLDDGTDAGCSGIREAQRLWPKRTPGAFSMGCAIDNTLVDFAHWNQASYEHMGRRAAQSILYQLNLSSSDAAGPEIESVSTEGTYDLYVKCSRDIGRTLTESDGTVDTTALTGFRVSQDNFSTTKTIDVAEFYGRDLLHLHIASPITDGPVEVDYLAGKTPTTTKIVYDDAKPQGDTLGLPLVPSLAIVANPKTTAITLSQDDIDTIAVAINGIPADLTTESVPTSRVFKLVNTDDGLVGESAKTIIAGAPANTFAVDFREDAATNQKIFSIDSLDLIEGADDGVTISDVDDWRRNGGTMAIFQAAGFAAGDCTYEVEITYSTGPSTRGRFTFRVI